MSRAKKARKVMPGEKVFHKKNAVYRVVCCDCALVHLMRFNLQGNRIVMQAWRDSKATYSYRRSLSPRLRRELP